MGNPVVRLTQEDGAYSVLVTNEVAGGVSRPFPMRLILHNDSTGCTAAAPGRRLERSDLALPRPNTRLEEAVAVVTQCAFFT